MLKRILWLASGAALVFLAGYHSGSQTTAQAAANRVYELRTYTTAPGRLDALNARFRNHTTRIFEKHGMKNVGYWVPQDGEKKNNTLIYVLSYESRAAAKKAWDAFRTDPEWVKARTESEKDGKIVEKVDSVYMDPVDYSALK